jgi:hypothetical protein
MTPVSFFSFCNRRQKETHQRPKEKSPVHHVEEPAIESESEGEKEIMAK